MNGLHDARLGSRRTGYGTEMTDYSDSGTVPVEDAAVPNPPTVDEVLERQREEHPDQASTSTQQPPPPP